MKVSEGPVKSIVGTRVFQSVSREKWRTARDTGTDYLRELYNTISTDE